MNAVTAPSPFSVNIPKWQTAWDSTSLGWFKKCPRYYQYQMIEQWSPRSKGIHLYFGGLYAAALERYAHAKAAGESHDASTLKMVKWVMENSGEYRCEVNGEDYEVERALSIPEGFKWRIKTGTEPSVWLDSTLAATVRFVPWESGDPIKNRYTLLRSLVWNVEDKLNSAFRTHILADGKPAVELSFRFAFTEIAGESIELSGHMDEVVEEIADPTSLWVRDDKTTKGAIDARYFAQYTPGNQMSLYTIAGRVVASERTRGVLVRAAQIGVGFTRFGTQQIPRTKPVLDEWMANTKRLITLAREYAIDDYFPMNDTACSDYGGCPFRQVCAVAPNHRKSHLQADFVKREWNPLLARGDI